VTIDPGYPAQVVILLFNPGAEAELVRMPLDTMTDGVMWSANSPTMRLGPGAANRVIFFARGAAVSCDIANLPWADGGITADGVPVEVTGQLCDAGDGTEASPRSVRTPSPSPTSASPAARNCAWGAPECATRYAPRA
jgi:hypothetical protein